MKEYDIISQMINELDAATAADVDVKTIGDDKDIDPPEVILDWDKRRLSDYNGHNSFGAYIKNNSDENIGIEHHAYFRMEVECIARSYDEFERDDLADTVEMAFIPYEKDATKFHRDTGEWDIEGTRPRENPVFEPEWFDSGVLVSFLFVKRMDDKNVPDPIRTIQQDVTVDESLEDTTDS